MKRVGLSVYGFSLYDSEAQTTINLNEVKESKNILEIIKQYIDDNGNKYENDASKERLYKFSDVKLEEIKIDEKKNIVYCMDA